MNDKKRRTNRTQVKKNNNKQRIKNKKIVKKRNNNSLKSKNRTTNIKRAKRGTKAKPTHQKVNREKLRRNIDTRVKIISSNITGFKVPLFIYFVLMYVSIAIFIMLTFFSKVEKLNKEILEMQDQKQLLTEEKRHLEILLESSYNVSNIKDITERRLNMRKPEEHQIIYIDTPKESSVTYKSNDEEESSFFNIFNN